MADTRVLLAGLETYQQTLDRHVSLLTSEFQQLSNVWQRLNHVYEGDAADQFRAGWIQTTQRFQEYIDESHRIRAMLAERIEKLRAANRAEGTLG